MEIRSMKKIFYTLICTLLTVSACVSLDIPPKNIVSDDSLLSNQAGMSIYLSRLYSQMRLQRQLLARLPRCRGNRRGAHP